MNPSINNSISAFIEGQFPEAESRPSFNRERFKEARLEARLTQTELAKRVEVSAETISNIESGQRLPGADTLAGICSVLGFPPRYFARSEGDDASLESAVFFRSYASKTKRQNHCLNVWRLWSGRLLAEMSRYLNLPPVRVPSVTWSGDCSSDGLVDMAEELAENCRRTWGVGDGPISNLTRLAESMGLCVVRLSLPDMEDVDGFSCWQNGRPFIFLVAKESAARERLNLAHEILHLIAHRQIPADALEDDDTMKRIEAQAFAFAGAFCLPRGTYGREVFGFKVPHFIEQKRRWGVSLAAQARRCLDMGMMDEDQYAQFRKNLSWHKYIKKEPLDDSLPHEQPLMIRQAIEMLASRGVVQAWQIAEKFGLPAEKMHQLTTLPASDFEMAPEPAIKLSLLPPP